jgi:N-acetylglucosaminyldiphosphoundecaprenol N-acetyl-beta-D-mannosaminyltransferase
MTASGVMFRGIRIDPVGYREIIERIDAMFAAGSSGVVTYSHFHTLLDATGDEAIRSVLNASMLNHPDGIGAALALRFLTGSKVRRVNGTDLYPSLISHLAAGGRTMYFLGGSKQAAQALLTTLSGIMPLLPGGKPPVIGAHHGDISLDDRSVVDDIGLARPDVLFIGLGSPKQYHWLRKYQSELRIPLIMLIGGGIEFLSGRRSRAPRWMRTLGLEWIHRLLREPRHVWRRYAVGIPRFVVMVLREVLAPR